MTDAGETGRRLGTVALVCVGAAVAAFTASMALGDPASSLLLAYAVLPFGAAAVVLGLAAFGASAAGRSGLGLFLALLALSVPALAVLYVIWALRQFD